MAKISKVTSLTDDSLKTATFVDLKKKKKKKNQNFKCKYILMSCWSKQLNRMTERTCNGVMDRKKKRVKLYLPRHEGNINLWRKVKTINIKKQIME